MANLRMVLTKFINLYIMYFKNQISNDTCFGLRYEVSDVIVICHNIIL